MQGTKPPNNIKWHTLTPKDALEKLDINPAEGLSETKVEKRREQYGKNELPAEKKTPAIIPFLLQFHNILIYVLLMAAVITGLLGHWIDTFVILGVVVVNAMVGYIQEGKAEEALEQLRQMLSPMAQVIREGKRKEIPAENLVPGDIVLLQSGDRVPADLRLLESRNLRIDEAMLTGEAQPAEKDADTVSEAASPGDRINMAFSGTMVAYGRGKGIVTGTGLQTEIGKIRDLISGVEQLTTPLLKKMDHFSKWLSVIIVLMAGIIFLAGWLITGQDIQSLSMSVIALAVAAIPEGLPAIMTITLAIGVRKMAGRNAIIRKLPAVETLGSVSVICTDKTGTLTRNEMMVTKISTSESSIQVSGRGYEPKGDFTSEDESVESLEDNTLKALLECAFYCNDAEINRYGDKWILTGDPTEGALIAVGAKAGLEKKTRENGWIPSLLKVRTNTWPYCMSFLKMTAEYL